MPQKNKITDSLILSPEGLNLLQITVWGGAKGQDSIYVAAAAGILWSCDTNLSKPLFIAAHPMGVITPLCDYPPINILICTHPTSFPPMHPQQNLLGNIPWDSSIMNRKWCANLSWESQLTGCISDYFAHYATTNTRLTLETTAPLNIHERKWPIPSAADTFAAAITGTAALAEQSEKITLHI